MKLWIERTRSNLGSWRGFMGRIIHVEDTLRHHSRRSRSPGGLRSQPGSIVQAFEGLYQIEGVMLITWVYCSVLGTSQRCCQETNYRMG